MADFITVKEEFAKHTTKILEDYLNGFLTDEDLRRDLILKANELGLLFTEERKYNPAEAKEIIKAPHRVGCTCTECKV